MVVGAKLAGVAAAIPLLVAGVAALARLYFGVGAGIGRKHARSSAAGTEPGGSPSRDGARTRRKAKPYRGPSSKRARADRERADRARRDP